jgi:hypothetical protein
MAAGRPFITRDMLVTAFGSCFAQHLTQWLMRQQYSTGERLAFLKHGADLNIFDSHVIRFGEGMVNTFALRQQFEWALEGQSFTRICGSGRRRARRLRRRGARRHVGAVHAVGRLHHHARTR